MRAFDLCLAYLERLQTEGRGPELVPSESKRTGRWSRFGCECACARPFAITLRLPRCCLALTDWV